MRMGCATPSRHSHQDYRPNDHGASGANPMLPGQVAVENGQGPSASSRWSRLRKDFGQRLLHVLLELRVRLRVVEHGERGIPDRRDDRRPEVGVVECVVSAFVFEQGNVRAGRPVLLGEAPDRGDRGGLVDCAREEADRAAHQRPGVKRGVDRGVERQVRAELEVLGRLRLQGSRHCGQERQPPPRDPPIRAIRAGSTLGWVARSARAWYTLYTCPVRLSCVSGGNCLIPRPVKLSTTNTATPCDRSSRAQVSSARPTPPPPCDRTTTGTRPSPFGSSSSPEMVTGCPVLTPSQKSRALSVSVSNSTSPLGPWAIVVMGLPVA